MIRGCCSPRRLWFPVSLLRMAAKGAVVVLRYHCHLFFYFFFPLKRSHVLTLLSVSVVMFTFMAVCVSQSSDFLLGGISSSRCKRKQILEQRRLSCFCRSNNPYHLRAPAAFPAGFSVWCGLGRAVLLETRGIFMWKLLLFVFFLQFVLRAGVSMLCVKFV